MELSEVLDLYDQEERISAEWPAFAREATPHIVRQVPASAGAGAPVGRTAVVAYSRLEDSSADRVIEEQVEWAAARGLALSWKLYGHDAPPDLAKRLVAHGFEPQEPESIMVLDLKRAPATLLAPPVHDLRRIADSSLISHVSQVNRVVWGKDQPELYAELSDTLERRPKALSVYVAYHDDAPVGAAWLRVGEGKPFASLWGGSTLPEYRGRGYYTALLAVRVQEAVRRGARFLTVDAGPMSRPIVARHGFQEITTACDYDTP